MHGHTFGRDEPCPCEIAARQRFDSVSGRPQPPRLPSLVEARGMQARFCRISRLLFAVANSFKVVEFRDVSRIVSHEPSRRRLHAMPHSVW
jgi:hypothetical protein